MIFSLQKQPAPLSEFPDTNIDLFCFFTWQNAVLCPQQAMYSAISSSLRNKHCVLILGPTLNKFPSPDDSKRWQLGEDWIYLTPRFLNEFRQISKNLGTNFVSIQTVLTTYKSA